MSEYRPHVKRPTMRPAIKDKRFLVGKEDLTPQERAEWLRQQPKEVQDAHREMGHRHDLILKARALGLIGWEDDYTHYRDGTPYCKCPAVEDAAAGTVAAHNLRYEKLLASVDDGR